VIRCQITDGAYSRDPDRWFRKLRGDADFVQIREPDLEARDLARLTRRVIAAFGDGTSKARVLVNDRIDVAMACGAAGVHLKSGSIDAARVKGLAPMIVTVACHSGEDPQKYRDADLIVLAPVFAPLSKTAERPALGLAKLADFARRSPVPVIALGGITESNADACIQAGAAGIAGISIWI
jgi:thiamine-phosphate pyrophosphorylase